MLRMEARHQVPRAALLVPISLQSPGLATPLEPPERKQYLAEYTARVAASYLPQADGKVLLRFPRIFIVAVK